MLTVLQNPRLACEPRTGVPLKDLSVIELHTMLAEDGWTVRVKPPKLTKSMKQKCKGDDPNMNPQDYTVGSPECVVDLRKSKIFQCDVFPVPFAGGRAQEAYQTFQKLNLLPSVDRRARTHEQAEQVGDDFRVRCRGA